MKYSNNILTLIILCLSAFMIHAQECDTKLMVESDFSETYYYLNDTLVGSGIKLEIIVTPGIHILYVMENSDRWDSKAFTDTIVIKACETLKLSYKLRSDFLLRTEPDDVEVISNGSLSGRTPLLLAYDSENILLRKKGFADKKIKLSDFKTADVINLDYIESTTDKSFFQKDIFKILMGSIIVLGGTSAYFKIQADEKFEEYEVTGEGKLLDETRKYDLVSGIIFSALQINFGILIYHFLVE